MAQVEEEVVETTTKIEKNGVINSAKETVRVVKTTVKKELDKPATKGDVIKGTLITVASIAASVFLGI